MKGYRLLKSSNAWCPHRLTMDVLKGCERGWPAWMLKRKASALGLSIEIKDSPRYIGFWQLKLYSDAKKPLEKFKVFAEEYER